MAERDLFRFRQFFGGYTGLLQFRDDFQNQPLGLDAISGSSVASIPSSPGSPGV